MRHCLLFLLLVPGATSFARDGSIPGPDTVISYRHYPVPAKTERLMFFVQRTHNRNTIVYELNRKEDGTLDPEEPLCVEWVRFEEGGVRKELSYLQRRVFGIEVLPAGAGRWLIRFRAYEKREIYLSKSKETGRYRALVRINGKVAELTRLFLGMVTNALGIPSVIRYVDIHGIDPATGKPVMERIIP